MFHLNVPNTLSTAHQAIKITCRLLTLLLGVTITTQIASANTSSTPPIGVVELFTSQGCSSCPPADRVLSKLAQRNDLIALSFHVDYWDYLGWKDQFARPEFTDRQRWYAQVLDSQRLYTPQMVVSGREHYIGSKAMEVLEAVAKADNRLPLTVSLHLSGDTLSIKSPALDQANRSYFISLIRFTPRRTIAILSGENAGASATYSNIVNSADIVAKWTGKAPLSLKHEISGTDPIVILVQDQDTGRIIGAQILR